MNITIEPLTSTQLHDAITLVTKVFSYEPADFITETLTVGVQANLPHVFHGITCTDLHYFVAIDAANNRVVGTTGLYTDTPDEAEAVWISWFCVDPDYRNRGIGRQLLEFMIAHTKKMGKRYLRVYTEEHPNELLAHALYERYGFVPFEPPPELKFKEPMLYKQLLLKK